MVQPSPPVPRCYALVPCAGVGERAGAVLPKQYAPLAGRPLVAHTLAALRAVPAIVATLVVVSPDDTHFAALIGPTEHDRDWLAASGGASRAQTVANGLVELRHRGATDADWVLVHDAARCLLRPAWVQRLIDACSADQVGGLLAVPLADTLKREVAERVQATVDRRGLWAAQTPQMFRLALLQRALEHAGPQVTDEASAIEALGLRPRLVPGEWENLKITWPADFGLAQRLLATR
ncbi:MAG: 2-C-methyl-D-erythritol 4-phosphate cytidylyltransferase [Rubrivivax sp.]|jgi:2-C-methyl-D-erythritol 4-phosphate cytidylyltransferase|nr:2-C-methyl-D-erythritol 4-phosphate cytidylyltransferase [Rubrivivax sp.]